jgi:hypothetical protein
MDKQKFTVLAHPNPAANAIGALFALGALRLIRESRKAGVTVCDGFQGVTPSKPKSQKVPK